MGLSFKLFDKIASMSIFKKNYLYILIIFMLPESINISTVIHPELERLREEITSIDREIVNLLHERSLKIVE